MQSLEVSYQGKPVGALSFDTTNGQSTFEYHAAFVQSGIELSPLMMPLRSGYFTFSHLNPDTFKGLPGLIADSLPDDFGNTVLNEWAARQQKQPSDISPIERLQYTGKRGMGALEFSPAKQLKNLNSSQNLSIDSLVEVAQEVLNSRQSFSSELKTTKREDRDTMLALLSVGMSAGGARAKAVLAFNNDFTRVKSGQVDVPPGYTHHLMKFDGVQEHRQSSETFGDPLGYGAMEYVYYLMATSCQINMMPSRLLDEGNRRHFITQRYDRDGNTKFHVQTLNGLAHVDYKQPGLYSYTELFGVLRQLKMTAIDAEQLFRRMAFNIVARNHDDHSKNFSFMLKDGRWQLTPCYDIAYSYKPGSFWVNDHWMILNGKRDGFTREDFYSLSPLSQLFSKAWIDNILNETIEAVSQWRKLATQQEVPQSLINEVEENLRLTI